MTAALSVCATMIASSANAEGSVKKYLCHNIGGPQDKGANCEATGFCTFILQDGTTLFLEGDQFLGIVIPVTGANAIAAHLAHGDGWAVGPLYNPPLHLASVVGPHQVSNVQCFARRVIPQPPEPGN
jgi:hypothetical protein